jgi:hypothetical protein
VQKPKAMKLKAQSFVDFFLGEQGACLHTLTHVLSIVFPIFLNDSWSSCCFAPLHCFLCVGIWSDEAQILEFCYSLMSYSNEQGSHHPPSHPNPFLLHCFHGSS